MIPKDLLKEDVPLRPDPTAEEDTTRQECIRSEALKLDRLVPTSMGKILNRSECVFNDMPWTTQSTRRRQAWHQTA